MTAIDLCLLILAGLGYAWLRFVSHLIVKNTFTIEPRGYRENEETLRAALSVAREWSQIAALQRQMSERYQALCILARRGVRPRNLEYWLLRIDFLVLEFAFFASSCFSIAVARVVLQQMNGLLWYFGRFSPLPMPSAVRV